MGNRFGRDGADTLTMEEVEKHSTKDDAWLVLFGEAIDVSKFIPLHPGGEDSILSYLGKDATKDWQMIHTADAMEKYTEHLAKKGQIRGEGGLLNWLWKRISTPGGAYARPPAGAKEPEANAAEEPTQVVEPVKWSAEHEAELPPGRSFDLPELARWDGVELPMCISVCGVVVDVSASDNFVPNFGYGKLWAGRETTWAMATVSLKAHDANRFDFKLEDLSPEQFKALAGWYKHFTGKYRQVGTLKELRDWDFSSVVAAAAELPVSGFSGTGGAL